VSKKMKKNKLFITGMVFTVLLTVNAANATLLMFEGYTYSTDSIWVEPTAGAVQVVDLTVTVGVEKGLIGGLTSSWTQDVWNALQSGQIRSKGKLDETYANIGYIYYSISAPDGYVLGDIVASPRVGSTSAVRPVTFYAYTDVPTTSNSGNWDYGLTAATTNEYLTIDLSGNQDYQNLNTIYFIIQMPHGVGSTITQGYLYDFTINGEIIPVPEPATLGVLLVGSLLVFRRRK